MQGWIFKPKGFKKGEEKAWPVALLIHGGAFLRSAERRAILYVSDRSGRCVEGPVVDAVESECFRESGLRGRHDQSDGQ